ncbi:MAG TPA: SDR family NAD(P)-dependent oxidoreductase [Rubrivivax sp.]|nr:SDR family NAD(P)-dependent oxidoreductase [Burkholderiales bacterium]HNT39656.1 SDR family NAD(P)-dependent oxidoreductase [Rubrivivax sp.]
MSITLSIVTGASRGLGRAVAEQLLARGEHVIAISRQAPEGLSSPRLQHWSADLAEAGAVATRLHDHLQAQGARSFASLALINNAGVIPALAPLGEVDGEDLARALRVGLEAPMRLTAAFLAATRGWTMPRKLLLVSSGLGRRAMAGSASYCAAKAGLDHLARAVALEEAAQAHGARIVSLAPGVIDTDMQRQLRSADALVFPEREHFAALHRDGRLDSPATAAARLIGHLDRADFGSDPVADVRHG